MFFLLKSVLTCRQFDTPRTRPDSLVLFVLVAMLSVDEGVCIVTQIETSTGEYIVGNKHEDSTMSTLGL